MHTISLRSAQKIKNHGTSTNHVPELVLNGFGTRLGHRTGRFLGSLFPHDKPEFQGRQVVTFHNQRDFLFVRHHRYVFQEGKKRSDYKTTATLQVSERSERALTKTRNIYEPLLN